MEKIIKVNSTDVSNYKASKVYGVGDECTINSIVYVCTMYDNIGNYPINGLGWDQKLSFNVTP